MKKKPNKIGILTSGGDAPGMNVAIRTVVRTSILNNIEVVGIVGGYEGLLNNDFIDLNIRSVSGIINKGGTFLYTARSERFKTEEGQNLAVENCLKKGLDSLIIIGGDGSFIGAHKLSQKGINCICIPGTIDNDIACTEYSIGYDTALNTSMELIDKIRDTAQSHSRCSIVEVMGRDSGNIALNTGIACGATSILIPEFEVDIERDVIQKINDGKARGEKHFIIVISEGVKITSTLEKYLKENTDLHVITTILGHVQRGGSPTLRDRVMASKLAYEAVCSLIKGENDKIVSVKNDEVILIDINDAHKMKRTIDMKTYKMAHQLSI